MSSSPQVLDTFKFKEKKIFLKQFHIQRTFEACCLLNPNSQFKNISVIYDLLENSYDEKIQESKLFRATFTPGENLDYQVETVDPFFLPEILRLQLITELRQPSGTGKQNYKWTSRTFWDDIKKLKSPDSDDVMAVNEKDEITETSRFNLFLYDPRLDIVITPPLSTGCINGVYRRHVMEQKSIMLPALGAKMLHEENCRYQNISRYEIFVANSIREVKKAQLMGHF